MRLRKLIGVEARLDKRWTVQGWYWLKLWVRRVLGELDLFLELIGLLLNLVRRLDMLGTLNI